MIIRKNRAKRDKNVPMGIPQGICTTQPNFAKQRQNLTGLTAIYPLCGIKEIKNYILEISRGTSKPWVRVIEQLIQLESDVSIAQKLTK